MQSLTFINARGESIQFGRSAPYVLASIKGVGGSDTSKQTTKAPYQDGETLKKILMGPRIIELEGTILGATRAAMYEKRQEMMRILNPKLGPGVLTYTNDHTCKEISATPETAPVPSDIFVISNRFSISFYCHLPFWMDPGYESVVLRYMMGGLTFPMILPTAFSERSYKRVMTNSGDVETPFEIEFYGPAINPTVKNNSTGEVIIVKRTLKEGETLLISTEFGKKRVEVLRPDGSRENVFNWIDLSSSFFQLLTGDNELEYTSNNDSYISSVLIKYRNRYVGV